MRIVKVDDRYFVVSTERDVHDVALKVLNEHRIHGTLPEGSEEFAEQVCEEMDGGTAWSMVSRMHSIRAITPEVV